MLERATALKSTQTLEVAGCFEERADERTTPNKRVSVLVSLVRHNVSE